VNKFNTIDSFQESVSKKRTQQDFYKSNTKLSPRLLSNYKDMQPEAFNLLRNSNLTPHNYDTSSPKLDTYGTVVKQRNIMASTMTNFGGADKLLP